MIFLYSYTIFCAFFLFALDHLDDFCFVHKFRIRKILSHYFTFQLFAFFIQFLSFQCLAYLNIANLNAALSFISRMTGIISFGYVAYLIDYFWLENRLKLKKKIIYYTVIITIAEFIFFLTNEFTAKFNIYFHLAERFANLSLFLIIIFYMIFMFRKIQNYYCILYICMLTAAISAIITDNSDKYGLEIINLTFGIVTVLIFVKFYADIIHNDENKLSRKDREIIDGVLNNLSNSDLAAKFNTAESTIKNKLTRIYKILGINDRQDLIDKYKNMKSQL